PTGAFLCGRRNVPARLRAQSSWTARCLHGLPGWWSGYAGAQSGIPLSDGLAVRRDVFGRFNLLLRLLRVLPARADLLARHAAGSRVSPASSPIISGAP